MNTININGIEYVEASSVLKVSGDYCIVRTKESGVFAGVVVEKENDKTVLKNARRLWYWKGAASLSELAVAGVSCPDECKFPVEVPEIEVLGTIERIPCTEKAIESIKNVPIWTAHK